MFVKFSCQSTAIQTNLKVDIVSVSDLLLYTATFSFDLPNDISTKASYISGKSYLKGFIDSTRLSQRVVRAHFKVKEVICFFNTDHLVVDVGKKTKSS